MIKSMTGFGRGKYENEGRSYTVEIKSVNHKYSDINVRIPRILNSVEDKIRKKVDSNISRGKIDVFVSFENYSSQGFNIRINRDLAKKYIEELRLLSEETGIKFDLNAIDVSKLPEILKIEDEEDTELIENEVLIATDEAIKNFVEMRAIEGDKLIKDLKNRIDFVESKVNEIKEYSKDVVQDYMIRLRERLDELLVNAEIDEARLMQEIVIFSDKSSIEEELTRLDSHIVQFNNLLKGESPIGKKFDFLIQEINREVNTIGSKANCLDITNRVIEIKTEVENIREQIQNIE